MAKFPLAYCPLTKEDVTPDQVVDMYAEMGNIPLLQCADPVCRGAMPETKMSAVNCKHEKTPDDAKIPTPYFRTHQNHEHSEDCQYERYAKHMEYVLKHKKEFLNFAPDVNLLKKLKGIPDTSILPDIYEIEYNPKSYLEEIERVAQRYKSKSGRVDKNSYRLALASVPQRTSSLTSIVRIMEQLHKSDERENVSLSLPGRVSATFEDAFFALAGLKNFYKTPYIYCSVSKITPWEDGYLIKYKWPLKSYHPDYPQIKAYTPISSKIHRPSLLKELESYAKSGEDCCIYSFSTHSLKENTFPDSDCSFCVLIEPRTPDAVVIRKRCLNRSKKSKV